MDEMYILFSFPIILSVYMKQGIKMLQGRNADKGQIKMNYSSRTA